MCLGVTASLAHAQHRPPPAAAAPTGGEVGPTLAIPPPIPSPAEPISAQFVTLDRSDASSRVGAQLAYTSLDSADPISSVRIDVFGQAVTRRGLGVYGTLAIATVDATRPDTDESFVAASRGNLEIGGLFVAQKTDLGFIARAGLALPTAGTSLESFISNGAGASSRLTDLALIAPEVTWIRLSASQLYRSKHAIVRGDAGVDLAIDAPAGFSATTLIHANLAVGLIHGGHQISLELVNVIASDESLSDHLLHSLGMSYRAPLGAVEPFVGIVKPFGASSRDLAEANFALVAGVSAPVGR